MFLEAPFFFTLFSHFLSHFFHIFSHFFHTFFALFLHFFCFFSEDFANFRFSTKIRKSALQKCACGLEALWPVMVAWPWLGLRPWYLTLGFWFWQEAPGWWPGGCFMLFSFLGSFIGSYVLHPFPFFVPFFLHIFFAFLRFVIFFIAFLLHFFYTLFFWEVAFFLDVFCNFIILLFSNDSLLPTHINVYHFVFGTVPVHFRVAPGQAGPIHIWGRCFSPCSQRTFSPGTAPLLSPVSRRGFIALGGVQNKVLVHVVSIFQCSFSGLLKGFWQGKPTIRTGKFVIFHGCSSVKTVWW